MSACPVTNARSSMSLAVRAGVRSSLSGKLIPLSERSRLPLACATVISSRTSLAATPRITPPMRPSSNSTRSPGCRSTKISGRVQGSVAPPWSGSGVRRMASPGRSSRSPLTGASGPTRSLALPCRWRNTRPDVKWQVFSACSSRTPSEPRRTTWRVRRRPEASRPCRRFPGFSRFALHSRAGSGTASVSCGRGKAPGGTTRIRTGWVGRPIRSRGGRARITAGWGASWPVRSFGPARSMAIAQGRPVATRAALSASTIRPQTSGSSWAQLMRAMVIPAVSRSATRAGRSAASAGRVTMIPATPAAARAPNSRSQCCSSASGAPSTSGPPGCSCVAAAEGARPSSASSAVITASRLASRWASQSVSAQSPRCRSAFGRPGWAWRWKEMKCSRLRALAR